jgi:hypothetical protein
LTCKNERVQTRTRIVGLREAVRDLRRVDKELPKRLNAFMEPIASRGAAAAQQRGRSLGGVHAHVAGGITSGASGGRPFVSLNPNQQPAIFGAEFGGGRRPTTQQFPPWRGTGMRSGYMLMPVMYERHDEIRDEIEAAVYDLLDSL